MWRSTAVCLIWNNDLKEAVNWIYSYDYLKPFYFYIFKIRCNPRRCIGWLRWGFIQLRKTLGIAFQLKDDYLDAYGNTSKTGKQLGGDILSNKKTFLSAKAFEIASDEQKLFWVICLQELMRTKLKIHQTFDQLNIKQYLKLEMDAYTTKAYELLEKVPVISKRKSLFKRCSWYKK